MQSGMSQRRCNLLLVEDQLDLAALMEQALEDAGDQVTHAYSVFDALGLLDNQRFDGAVLDVELRDGVVFPVADRLTELGIPFLFVSAVYDQIGAAASPSRRFRGQTVPRRRVAGDGSARHGGCLRATAGALIAMGGHPRCGATTRLSWRSAPPRESPSQLLRATLRISESSTHSSRIDQ